MGFLNRLRSTPDDEQRSLPSPVNELPLWSAYAGPGAIAPHQALQIADVWACVRLLADSVSSLPLYVYRTGADGDRTQVTSGKLVDLLDRPSPAVTQADLISTMMVHLTVYGNCFLGKFRTGGQVDQLALLHPDRVRPELHDGEIEFRYSPAVGPTQVLTTADVVHIRGLSVDGIYGLSAAQQAGRVLGLSDRLVQHALGFFERGGGLPTAILKMPPESTSVQRQDTVERTRNDMVKRGVLVIEGEGDFSPVSVNLDTAQFTEQRKLSAQEVARVFRVPPHLIAAQATDRMTYSTTEQQSLDFVRHSLIPWTRKIELAISGDPDLAFAAQWVRFDFDSMLRADAATRAQVYALALDPVKGWMTRDEVRELEGLDPEEQAEPASPIADAIAAITSPQGVISNGQQP